MTTYRTPGVYIEEISKFPPSIAEVETAIPAFIGHTEMAIDSNGKSLTLIPTRITSLLEYSTLFGFAPEETVIEVSISDTGGFATLSAAPSPFIMYNSLSMYFGNGGGPCYIVSVGDYTDTDASTTLNSGLDKLKEEDEPTIIVFPEATFILTESEHYTLMNNALNQCGALQDRVAVIDVHPVSDAELAKEFKDTRQIGNHTARIADARNGLTSSFLKYGAVYYPNLISTLRYNYAEADVSVTYLGQTYSLDTLNPTVTNAQQNTSGSGSGTGSGSGSGSGGGSGSGSGSGSGATVAPDNASWIYNKAVAAIKSLGVLLPPSVAVAGVYAMVDSTRGVWKAPANVGLNYVKDLTLKVTNDIQDSLNIDTNAGKSVNAIRAFSGKGILVWGSRTLAGNDNEWRYVPVRRFFNMVEESVKKSTSWAVFEPNDANTWMKVKSMIENYLFAKWKEGALAGAKPDDSYYVKVGLGQTMTAQDILNGYMYVEIGMAVVRPAEFIVLKFSHKLQQS